MFVAVETERIGNLGLDDLGAGRLGLEHLAWVVDALTVDATGDAIAAVARIFDKLGARLTDAIGRFDRSGEWALDGSVSMTAWVRNTTGLGATGTAMVNAAHKLSRLPVTNTAYLDGRLSTAQIREVVSVAERHVDLLAEHEAEVLAVIEPLSVKDAATVMKRWKANADSILETPPVERRGLHLAATPDGTWHLDGTFDSLAGIAIDTALKAATTRDTDDNVRTGPQRRADALVEICDFYNSYHARPPGVRHRPHINVIVDVEALIIGPTLDTRWETFNGQQLAAWHLEELSCDANIHRVVMSGRSSILDYGRSTQTVSTSLFNAVATRDRRCRYPGCDRPVAWCDAHHVRHWIRGGATRAGNLVLLCSRHHHIVHTPGWHLELQPDATLTVTHPDGTITHSRPPP